MQYELWTYYLTGGVILCVLEIFVPSFICFPLGVGAVLAAPISLVAPWPVALIAWLGFSFVTFKLFGKYSDNKSNFYSNYEGMIDQIVIVTKTIDPLKNTGEISYLGQLWGADNSDKVIHEGSKVKIVKIQGNRVIVQEVTDATALLEKDFDKRLNG